MQRLSNIRKMATTALCAGVLAIPLTATAQEEPGDGTTINMARATWDTGWWQAEVYASMLEELGYEVSEATTLDNPPFYQSVAFGDVDLWVNGWFPLHNTYEDSFADGAEAVGHVAKGGALQGYLIDKKTADEHDITHVEDLTDPEIQALFDADGDGLADLVACPPSWGCEEVISHHFEEFGWDEHFKPITAGYSASMADTVARYDNGDPIFFYTWTPNWTVGILPPGEDVVWLQMDETSLPEDQMDLADATEVEGLAGCAGGADPCDLGWPANDIRPVANSAFLDDNPAVRALLEVARIPIDDIFAQNAMMNEGEDSAEDLSRQASEWIDDNRDQVDEWLATAREAAEG
ncbi:MAG: glycine betaine/proline transport system substrate-binding protein [Rhodobacteraceae bacterium HLUCCO07]|nr:MAG: glycine betaine/proline transport system substrate-binding protein [Rhodobacteraceae bacterium HLUCCO07]